MASGNLLENFWPARVCGPTTSAAQIDFITGASSPAEYIQLLAFDQTTAEYADFMGEMPSNYAGGGLTCKIKWAAGATTGGVTFRIALRRTVADTTDLDTTAFTYDFNDNDIAGPSGTVGKYLISNITFTDGADMDSVVAGDLFLFRVARNPADANDTMAADARILSIRVEET